VRTASCCTRLHHFMQTSTSRPWPWPLIIKRYGTLRDTLHWLHVCRWRTNLVVKIARTIYMSLSAADLNDVCVSVVKRICNQLTWSVVTGRVRTLPSLHRTHAACYRWLSETLANSWSYVLRLGSLSMPAYRKRLYENWVLDGAI